MHQKHNHKIIDSRREVNQKKIFISFVLNLSITIIELIGGIISGSMALIADAVHNMGDSLALINSYLAYRISKTVPNKKMTFGYGRIEILTAIINSLILIFVSILILYNSIKHLFEFHTIQPDIMLGLSLVAFIINIISVALLHYEAQNNLNIKSSYLHLISDSLFSIAVFIGALFIKYLHIYKIDAILSILIGLFILYSAIMIVKKAIAVFLQRTPKGIDMNKITTDILSIYSVKGVHHIHTWQLTDKKWFFECHIELETDILVSQTEKIKKEIECLLLSKYNFNHVMLQFEIEENHEKDLYPNH